MTAKESQKMRKLEIENQELRAKLDKHIHIYGDQLVELIELRTRLQLVGEAINLERVCHG